MYQRMNPILRAEVDRQLLEDLQHYGIDIAGAKIDWSNECGEGHCTQVLNGNLEETSGLTVVGRNMETVAEGWMDFIHGGGDNPFFVFWLFLDIFEHGQRRDVKENNCIPLHIWDRLPNTTKDLCARSEGYDRRWCKDPLVLAWVKSRSL